VKRIVSCVFVLLIQPFSKTFVTNLFKVSLCRCKKVFSAHLYCITCKCRLDYGLLFECGLRYVCIMFVYEPNYSNCHRIVAQALFGYVSDFGCIVLKFNCANKLLLLTECCFRFFVSIVLHARNSVVLWFVDQRARLYLIVVLAWLL